MKYSRCVQRIPEVKLVWAAAAKFRSCRFGAAKIGSGRLLELPASTGVGGEDQSGAGKATTSGSCQVEKLPD